VGPARYPGEHGRPRIFPQRDQRRHAQDERTSAWLRRDTPLPVEGSVDDLLGAILWLVSDAGRYVTGQTIVIDGGWTAR
jgi:NAD(P)-dependent dehydrogenase (short-subunit alcohol dehydrogenase family)